MEKFVIVGGKKLSGRIKPSGAKNVALKALVAACLTQEEVVIENIPLISDFFVMAEIIKELGGELELLDHKVRVRMRDFKKTQIALERGAEIRTSALFLAPLLARKGEALIPNPGGCRIGARPIDRTIEGIEKMGVDVSYRSEDGYFHMSARKGLNGIKYRFKKNTHTGTETLLLASVLAKGETILENAAEEPEIDELINLLLKMGAKIKKRGGRIIEVEGVEKLKGVKFRIGPDRNEIVTIAAAAILTEGDILVEEADKVDLSVFLHYLEKIGAGVEKKEEGIRFFYKGELRPSDIKTSFHPGFMTDWQGPWCVLMTKANGTSTIHETVYENRFSYVRELRKMGAKIRLFNPEVKDPENFYNFNFEDDSKKLKHAAEIKGAVKLHNAVVVITDLRAGATLVLGALAASGESVILEIEHLDRGYENFEGRFRKLGAQIKREEE